MEELARVLAEKYGLTKEQEADLSQELHLVRLAWLEEGIRQGKETALELHKMAVVIRDDLSTWIKNRDLRWWGRPSYLVGKFTKVIKEFETAQ